MSKRKAPPVKTSLDEARSHLASSNLGGALCYALIAIAEELKGINDQLFELRDTLENQR